MLGPRSSFRHPWASLAVIAALGAVGVALMLTIGTGP
jgi:hypothetical protein